MAFIINQRGKRVNVDMEVEWFSNQCVLYADGATLRDCYILNLYKGKNGSQCDDDEKPSLIKQIEYWDNPPSKDEIMSKMWHEGLRRYDVATVEKGYMLDWEDCIPE